MSSSGWCSGPDGFRLKCDGCKSPTCDHECAQNPCSVRNLSITSGKMTEAKRPLGGAATPSIQGASPTLIRSID
jgi:hypothetical protein